MQVKNKVNRQVKCNQLLNELKIIVKCSQLKK